MRIGPVHFQARCRKRRINLTVTFCVIFVLLVFCMSWYFWVIVILCSQYQCNWLSGKTVPKMTYYVSRGTLLKDCSLTLAGREWAMSRTVTLSTIAVHCQCNRQLYNVVRMYVCVFRTSFRCVERWTVLTLLWVCCVFILLNTTIATLTLCCFSVSAELWMGDS